jgi:hypothetical protein
MTDYSSTTHLNFYEYHLFDYNTSTMHVLNAIMPIQVVCYV